VADSPPFVDYYAVLQVHPGAEREVLDAAYRQLMKKYHPDVAGDDPVRAELHHERAKAINEAYGVLRDPALRRSYDAVRGTPGGWTTTSARYRPAPPPVEPFDPIEHVDWVEPARGEESLLGATLGAPFTALSTLYYLLPGPYEWERGRKREFLTLCVLPPLGIVGFALATGRLAPLIGHSLNATLLAWAVLAVLSLPTWGSLPRVVMAGAPSALLMSGVLGPVLRQASMPAWLAWVLLGVLSLTLSARLYVFAILPTLGVCFLLAHTA
jgi:hypothetical protein